MAARLNTDIFVEKAKAVHGENYDYSETAYESSKKPVTVGCFTHGTFKITPNDHLQGGKCPKCVGKHRPSTGEFIENAQGAQDARWKLTQIMRC